MAKAKRPEFPAAELRDVLKWFRATNVSGIVIGGVAVSLLGEPRYTDHIRQSIAEFAAILERSDMTGELERLLLRYFQRVKK